MNDQIWKKNSKLHLAVSGRKWARVAHLQRHLSANRIKVSRSFSKFTYYAGSSVTLPKIVELFNFFITGGQKWRTIIKICNSSIVGENFLSPNIKIFLYRMLLTSEFRIDQSLLIWQFLYLCQCRFFWFTVDTNFAKFLLFYTIERVISRLLNESRI